MDEKKLSELKRLALIFLDLNDEQPEPTWQEKAAAIIIKRCTLVPGVYQEIVDSINYVYNETKNK